MTVPTHYLHEIKTPFPERTRLLAQTRSISNTVHVTYVSYVDSQLDWQPSLLVRCVSNTVHIAHVSYVDFRLDWQPSLLVRCVSNTVHITYEIEI